MSRHDENSMLRKFQTLMAAEVGLLIPQEAERPRSTFSVKSIKESEHWRNQIILDISRKLTKMQNPAISHAQIRLLNDELNDLVFEKDRWDHRLKQLGGKNFVQLRNVTDNQGREIQGKRGYRYFGRAKELPGIKEKLVDLPQPVPAQQPTPSLVTYRINADYFGFSDEDSASLLREEKKAESLYTKADILNSTPFMAIPPHSIPGQNEIGEYLLQRKKTVSIPA